MRLNVKYLLLTLLFLSLMGGIQVSRAQTIVEPDVREEPLTENEVRNWIRMRIKSHQLQMQMKADAAKYESVINAFFEKRDEMLVENGWNAQHYKDLDQLISATETFIKMEEEMAAEEKNRRKEYEDLLQSDFLTEDQKTQLFEGMREVHEQQQRYIDLYRHHMPAVRPYLGTLKDLTSWVAGNRTGPPLVD